MNASAHFSRRHALGFLGASGVAALAAACSSGDPLANDGKGEGSGEPGAAKSGGSGPIVVGSQAYYSNEIIAELFAQVLEKEGLKVERQYQIGQREVYMKELESGKVDVLPEYTGNLLQYYDDKAEAAEPAAIFDELAGVLPEGLTALPFAEATDQDSYTTTKKFADDNSLKAIDDLKNVNEDLKVAGNSELETRPFGPKGVKEAYGVDLNVVPVEDSGGPLTVKALTDGKAQLANIYTASPAVKENNLVALEDPEALILPQNVTPLVTAKVDDAARKAIAKVTEKLTTSELIELNAKSVNEQAKSADIAKEWLATQKLV